MPVDCNESTGIPVDELIVSLEEATGPSLLPLSSGESRLAVKVV
jgi:hypothetical protein